ncbi:MAG: NAD-dependent epimerase/dehydratase family protein [bacterium]
MSNRILLLGAAGQIGTELTAFLIEQYGYANVIASDIKPELSQSEVLYEQVDATDYNAIESCIAKYNVDTVYLMAAMLSATGEKYPERAWHLNMTSLMHVLNLAKEGLIKKVFWPSSIAVFGETTPKHNVSQSTITEPSTVYGISKLAGERWCEYYRDKYDVDVRSLRYPGIISWKAQPGGGTTDYAVEIFHEAVKKRSYNCFLKADSELPMMYMDDAIAATVQLMEAEREKLVSHISYNIAATSFTPEILAEQIKRILPDFSIEYNPDFRQNIADSWPSSIDDSAARTDWNWLPKYTLEDITKEMISKLEERYAINS